MTRLVAELVGVLSDRGLGASAKRDLDALILYLFEKHLGWAALSNQQLSVRMSLLVPKIESLRYEGVLRYTGTLTRVLGAAAASAAAGGAFDREGYGRIHRGRLRDALCVRGVSQAAGKIVRWTFNEECVSAPAVTVAAVLVDQFDEKDQADALAWLKISDPGSLAVEVEAAFLEIVEPAKRSKVVKLANVPVRRSGWGSRGGRWRRCSSREG